MRCLILFVLALFEVTSQTSLGEPIDSKLQRSIGEISRKKCKEYSAFAYKKFQAQNLISDEHVATTDECGSYKMPLIVDGTASLKQFPHMALIGFGSNSSNLTWLCGGSLISEQHILTLGLCTEFPNIGPAIYALLGTTDDQNIEDGQKIKIVERKAPPGHPALNLAILKLEKKVDISQKVRPACLATDPEMLPTKNIGTSWANSHKPEKTELRSNVINSFNCSFDKVGDTEFYLVNTYIEKRDCQSFVGGVLQALHSGDDVYCMYDIMGLTADDFGCFGGAAHYFKVASFVKWIEDTIWPQ